MRISSRVHAWLHRTVGGSKPLVEIPIVLVCIALKIRLRLRVVSVPEINKADVLVESFEPAHMIQIRMGQDEAPKLFIRIGTFEECDWIGKLALGPVRYGGILAQHANAKASTKNATPETETT